MDAHPGTTTPLFLECRDNKLLEEGRLGLGECNISKYENPDCKFSNMIGALRERSNQGRDTKFNGWGGGWNLNINCLLPQYCSFKIILNMFFGSLHIKYSFSKSNKQVTN